MIGKVRGGCRWFHVFPCVRLVFFFVFISLSCFVYVCRLFIVILLLAISSSTRDTYLSVGTQLGQEYRIIVYLWSDSDVFESWFSNLFLSGHTDFLSFICKWPRNVGVMYGWGHLNSHNYNNMANTYRHFPLPCLYGYMAFVHLKWSMHILDI